MNTPRLRKPTAVFHQSGRIEFGYGKITGVIALALGGLAVLSVLAAATTAGRRIEALFQLERYKDVLETSPPALIEYAAARSELSRR